MKKVKYFLVLIIAVGIFSSCLKDECTSTLDVFVYEPVYMTKDEIKNQTIVTEEAFPLTNPGKVYYSGNTLFVSEKGQGVHIFDNSDKTNPIPLSFLRIPGNVDVSFKDNHLLADSYLNILVIDLSDLNTPKVISRIEDIKSQYYYFDQDKNAYIIDYKQSDKMQKLPCNHPFFENTNRSYYLDDFNVFSSNAEFNTINSGVFFDASFTNSQGGNPGVAGSLSSFALVGDFFYFITGSDVNVYNISDYAYPYFTDGFEVAWNIETLFPYEDKLFIGGQNGMYIYDNSDPSSPQYLSEFVHARACDPVFVDGTTAYVTLSEGNTCANFTNQLDVIDFTDILNPTLIKSYNMYRPKGLSVYDNTLFLCDDKAGIKIFDVTDKETILANKLSAIQGNTFFEVIHISPTEILAIGPEGIFQYNVNDPREAHFLSHIPVSE